MELSRLRSFAAVAEAGHLTRAAEKLHISQPALSAQIRSLEDELDLSLFERTPAGMTLTQAGKRLLTEAEKVLAAAQALRAEARSLKGEIGGTAKLGTLSDPEFIRVGEFTTAAQERYPLLQIEFQHEITGMALEHVRDGDLDGSFYYGELQQPQVAGIALREIGYRVAAPGGWKERIDRAEWSEIAAEPWIMPPPVSTHHQLAHALLHSHGVEPAKSIGADHESVVSSLVASGLGIALIREDIASRMAQAGEVCLWRHVRVATMLWFIHLRSREHDPVIRALVDVLKDVWGLRHNGASATRGKASQRSRSSVRAVENI